MESSYDSSKLPRITVSRGGGGYTGLSLDRFLLSRHENYTTFLIPIFRKSMPEFMSTFQNVFPSLCQFFEKVYLNLYFDTKTLKSVPFLIPKL